MRGVLDRPALVAVAGALGFVLTRPRVGDMFAALARQSAAAHGVGLTYWFAWFGGGAVPGAYSVITPYASGLLGASSVGALATVAITPLTTRLVRGASHPRAAAWAATVGIGLSLWSGRIAFAVGTAFGVAALLAVRDGRRITAAGLAVVTVLASPVSGVLLVLGLLGLCLTVPRHRLVGATTAAAAGAALLVLLVLFGTPGPEGFAATDALLCALGLVLFLLARPQPFVTAVIVICLAACPLLVAVPNGMGSNFQRMVWICLPVAVIATARARLPVALGAGAVAILVGLVGTVQDLLVAASPMSSTDYYVSLERELDSVPDLLNYRVEIVTDGTHTASFALLGHAMLARGFETQADNKFDAVLLSPGALNAGSYQHWLTDNAVGFVAISTTRLRSSPEYDLVSAGGLAYLNRIWSDPTWTLYAVAHPTPILPPPWRIAEADQANLVIDVPTPGTGIIRVRWSPYLVAEPASGGDAIPLGRDPYGWSRFTAPLPGRYVLHG
jgi:hypothetical protein